MLTFNKITFLTKKKKYFEGGGQGQFKKVNILNFLPWPSPQSIFRIRWAMGQCRVGPCFFWNPSLGLLTNWYYQIHQYTIEVLFLLWPRSEGSAMTISHPFSYSSSCSWISSVTRGENKLLHAQYTPDPKYFYIFWTHIQGGPIGGALWGGQGGPL